jgi:hypothetical protein
MDICISIVYGKDLEGTISPESNFQLITRNTDLRSTQKDDD